MRYVILLALIGFLGFGLSLILFGLVATAGAPIPSLDAQLTATFPPDTEIRFREVHTAVRELVRGLIDEFTAPYPE
jgi:hypothetical protein